MSSHPDYIFMAGLHCYIEIEAKNFGELIERIHKVKEYAEKYPIRIVLIKDELNKLLEFAKINKENMQYRLAELNKAKALACIEEIEENPSCVSSFGHGIIAGW